MKRVTLLLLFVFLVFALAAAAQSTSNSSSSTGQASPTMNSQSNSTAQGTQASPTSSASQSPNDLNGNIVEGCVMQVEKDYYLQPVNGGNRLRLRGNHDFSADVGHQVRIEGTANAPNSQVSTGSTNGTSTNPNSAEDANAAKSDAGNESSQTSSSNTATEDFLVTRLTTISETCPANSTNAPSGPGGMSPRR